MARHPTLGIGYHRLGSYHVCEKCEAGECSSALVAGDEAAVNHACEVCKAGNHLTALATGNEAAVNHVCEVCKAGLRSTALVAGDEAAVNFCCLVILIFVLFESIRSPGGIHSAADLDPQSNILWDSIWNQPQCTPTSLLLCQP